MSDSWDFLPFYVIFTMTNFDPRFRFPSALGGNFVQLPSFWTIRSVVCCPEYRGCPYLRFSEVNTLYIWQKQSVPRRARRLSVMRGFTVYRVREGIIRHGQLTDISYVLVRIRVITSKLMMLPHFACCQMHTMTSYILFFKSYILYLPPLQLLKVATVNFLFDMEAFILG